jgi:lipopolysaccharide export system protein LptA
MKIKFLSVIFFSLFVLNSVNGQKKEKIKYQADELKYLRENREPVRKLINNVIFKQGTLTIICDSANFYNKRNIMEAYGNIIITDIDSLKISGNKLIYDGNKKIAKLRENVVYTKNNYELRTNFLDYSIKDKIGKFFEYGILKENENTLKSKEGIFYAQGEYSIFYNDVEFNGPEYILFTDSLKYNSINEVIVTYDSTRIVTEDNIYVHSLGGNFKTKIKSSFLKMSTIETNNYTLEANEINLDNNTLFYLANKNVKLKVKDSDYIVTGNKGYYDKKNNITKIYDNALLKKVFSNDTFYLSSDTIIAYDDSTNLDMIIAHNNVKFYKKNFKGKADSITFLIKDSIINMFNNPIIWNGDNQITSDSINFKIYGNNIEEMNLIKNAFIISRDSLKNFNQIKGKSMKAFFDDSNYLKTINVKGNGETIYFVLNETIDKIVGLNYIICSDLKLNFEKNEIKNIVFYKSPKAKLIPPHKIIEENLYLKSFNWRESEKPKVQDVVHYFRKKIYLRNEN